MRKRGDEDTINFFKGFIFTFVFSLILYGIIALLVIIL